MKSAMMLVCFFAFGFTHAAELDEHDVLEQTQATEVVDLFAAEDGEEHEEAAMDEHTAEDIESADANTKAPIWASFISNFKKCAPGCQPANYATYGKRGKPSCHNTGRAVDVGAIVCGGVTHKAINRGRYEKMVNCMKGKMIVLYRNGKGITTGHHDHAHFSNGCVLKGGKKYYEEGEVAL
jgi:hypothetical protein